MRSQPLRRFFEGQGHDSWRVFGAHPLPGGAGFRLRVWAPGAKQVWVKGDFDGWAGVPMQREGAVYTVDLEQAVAGGLYKFAILGQDGVWRDKADPFAFAAELRPGDASRFVAKSGHRWRDAAWMRRRAATDWHKAPISIYELHAGSWRRHADGSWYSWSELAPVLIEHVRALGFTHVELMPVMEHPYDPSWGYQVTGYFAPTARHGSPDEFRAFVDALHGAEIGVLVDWVPAHFPRDPHGLGRFDGTTLYEYGDPRLGDHPDWGTLVFDWTRPEVRSFLMASALFWLQEFHLDGLRVDAVASMLYRDYSRPAGAWVPNALGGNWNLEAASFLRDLNRCIAREAPGALSIAEESTAFPQVTSAPPPANAGPDQGLGFAFKWNMGWMHDTIGYMRRAPEHRSWHHNEMTFPSTWFAAEQFVLPLSHDEVVHGKGALVRKMGGRWQDGAAQLRAMVGWQWLFPGKKLVFMGAELVDDREWDVDGTLSWPRQELPIVAEMQAWIAALNDAYRALPALHAGDGDPKGLVWIDADDAQRSVYAFCRREPDDVELERAVVVVASFSDLLHDDYALRVPHAGPWRTRLRSDGATVGKPQLAEDVGGAWILRTTLPPFAVWLLEPVP